MLYEVYLFSSFKPPTVLSVSSFTPHQKLGKLRLKISLSLSAGVELTNKSAASL